MTSVSRDVVEVQVKGPQVPSTRSQPPYQLYMLPHYAVHPGMPTLAQVRHAVMGRLACLLVVQQLQGVQHD